MAALRAAKQALRREIKKRVAGLSEEEKVRQSQVVSQKLFEHQQYKSSERVAVFLSMSDEVHTEAIVQHMFNSGKVCFIPKYLTNSNRMDMLRLRSMEDLSSLPLTQWNIRQPGDNDTEREEALDTVPQWYRRWLHHCGRSHGQCDRARDMSNSPITGVQSAMELVKLTNEGAGALCSQKPLSDRGICFVCCKQTPVFRLQ
ncbi:5,10-methenyltetrahydrofolate synthetase (5-formyltetrahydrofolate cyclo-ligase) isoform X1 [Hoplias malabaricus]|uniref:5,10-methenyltetrahydrofolate synthetase (5-formyltetrahydrofolate cyclo-ligase) isoform X1 n=1 Tax=Hoplias malabaricus TaxID=27720 RepID=UPI003462C510